MSEESYRIFQGWLVCPCSGKAYVMLKETETYPCPKCSTELAFDAPVTEVEEEEWPEFIGG